MTVFELATSVSIWCLWFGALSAGRRIKVLRRQVRQLQDVINERLGDQGDPQGGGE